MTVQEKDICKIIENNETLLHLLLSALLINNKNLETQHKSFTVKQIGECYVVEETKSYKLDKRFLEENKKELFEIYNNMKKAKLF